MDFTLSQDSQIFSQSQDTGESGFFLSASEEEDDNSLGGWDLISGLPALNHQFYVSLVIILSIIYLMNMLKWKFLNIYL